MLTGDVMAKAADWVFTQQRGCKVRGTLGEIHANLDEAVVHLKRASAKARQGGHG